MKRSTFLVVIVIAVIISASLSVYLYVQHSEGDPCSTSAPSPYITEYCAINSLSYPNAIAVDSHGNAWFVIQKEGDLGVVYSSSSLVHTFHIPAGKLGVESWGIAVDNSRNLVWFTDYADNGIWSFNITTQQFTYYNVTYSASAFPYQLVVDSKGNVWFTDSFANAIGELKTNGEQISFPLPSQLTNVSLSGPFGLTEYNGTLWFTDPHASSIGSLSVSGTNNGYTFHVYNMTDMVSSPVGIAVDAQGNIWMTEHGPSLVAEYNPLTGYFRAITSQVPVYFGTSLPYFVYVDSNGNVWFDEHTGNAIGRFSPLNNSLVEYLIPTKVVADGNISGALTMALSPSGTPWFTELFAGKIGRVNLQQPINLGVSIQNSTNESGFSLTPGENLSLELKISSPANLSVQLAPYLSTYNSSAPFLFPSPQDLNKTEPSFLYSFTNSQGRGDFTSQLTIRDQNLANGTYYLTLSEISSDIRVSRVIQIDVS